jgi:hypothetical protein
MPRGESSRARSYTDRDPASEAARDRRNAIRRLKRAFEAAQELVYRAENLLDMWRNEEDRLNSSRINQIIETKELISKRRGVVSGIKQKLAELGISV